MIWIYVAMFTLVLMGVIVSNEIWDWLGAPYALRTADGVMMGFLLGLTWPVFLPCLFFYGIGVLTHHAVVHWKARH